MKRGLTLIETVLSIAIATVLMAALASFYIYYGRSIAAEEGSISVELGANAIIRAERSAALQASQVVASHSFGGTTYYSSATTTIFELPSITSSGSIIAGSYDYIGIYAWGTSVYQVSDIAAGSDRPSSGGGGANGAGATLLTNALKAFTVTYDNTSFPAVTNIVVNATTSKALQAETPTAHVDATLYLRNI